MVFTRGIFVVALIFAFIAYLLYPKPELALEGKKNIVIWLPGAASEELMILIEEFEKRHPDYHVQTGTATVRDSAGDPTRFLLGVAGDVPPDLIYFDRFAIVEWAARGAFTSLNDFLEKDRDFPDGIHKENYFVPAWNEAVYKGNTYAVPISIDTRALFYNKDALVRAGLVYFRHSPEVKGGKALEGDARPPKTWEELCRKLLHTRAQVYSDGKVKFSKSVNLEKLRIKENDVVVLLGGDKKREVFRGRINAIFDPNTFYIDLEKEQTTEMSELPAKFTGNLTVKVFDGNSYIVKLSRYDSQTGVLKTAGFIPLFGNSWLYMYGWLNGGKFMSENGTKCTLDSQKIVKSLEFITDMYDCLGGVELARVFQSSAAASGSILDPFLQNKIAMKIDVGQNMASISAYRPNMNFGAAPAPIPEQRLRAGDKSCGWLGGFAYAIPATAKNKEGAWKLMRWLCSMEASKISAEYADLLSKAKGQVYFPRLSPNIKFSKYLQKNYVDASPAISQNLKNAFAQFAALMPDSKYRPVTPVGQLLWNEQKRATELAIGHNMSAQDALSYGTKRVEIALNKFLHPPDGPEVPWPLLINIYIYAILAFIIFLCVRQWLKLRGSGFHNQRWYEGYICALPWLLGFFTLGAGPIVFSVIISLSHYNVLSPAKFIGFENYVNLVHDPIFWKSLKNTCFMVISVPLSIIVGILLAMFLNHKLRGIQLYRTLFYLPAIVPLVAALLLWLKLFDPKIGFINKALMMIGISNPPTWLNSPVWAKPAIIIMGLWCVGSSMIIWLAGLKNIPESLYEAAAIDGAGPWQRFRNITLPMLTPYIFFNLIMGLIGVFQIFEQAYIMTEGGPEDATLFYAYKLFNEAFRYLNFGAASAMGWILFIVVCVITLINFWLGKRWVYYND
jgi:multiple sugar transport system permease protein